jgi:hypothetical protein
MRQLEEDMSRYMRVDFKPWPFDEESDDEEDGKESTRGGERSGLAVE